MFLFCTLVYAFFVFIDVVPIVQNKKWKVFAVYGIIIVTAYVFTVLTELGVQLPSPLTPIKKLITLIVGNTG
jgi:hypothetical protein